MKPPYDRFDELHVSYVGEDSVEFPDSMEVTDLGLFEIEETNLSMTDALGSGYSEDVRDALREAEQMRRLIKAAPEMYQALQAISTANHQEAEWAREALPDLDADLDECFPWLGERDTRDDPPVGGY